MSAVESQNGNHAIFVVEDGLSRPLPDAGPTEPKPCPLPRITETPLARLIEGPSATPPPNPEPPVTEKPTDEPPTLRLIIQRWRRGQEGRSEATLEKHDYTIGTLERYLPLDRPIGAYTAQDIRDALAEARKRKLKGQTINETILRLLRNAFDLAVEDRLIPSNPVSNVKGERRQPIIRKQLTWEEANRVLEDIRDRAPESYRQLKFMLLLGVGKAEAEGLTGGAVDWQQKQISFVRKKTREPFVVPIYPWAEEFVRELQPRFRPGELVFNWRNPRKALITACTRCGVETMTTVSLRRTLIIHLLENGIEPRLVAKWQGHRDATLIHKVYGKHINAAHERAQLAKLSAQCRSTAPSAESVQQPG